MASLRRGLLRALGRSFAVREERRTTLRLCKAHMVLGERPGLGDHGGHATFSCHPVLAWGTGSGDGKRTKFGGGGRVTRVVKNWVQISAPHLVPLSLVCASV